MERGEEEAASSTTGISFSKAPPELKSYTSFSSTVNFQGEWRLLFDAYSFHQIGMRWNVYFIFGFMNHLAFSSIWKINRSISQEDLVFLEFFHLLSSSTLYEPLEI